MSFTFVYQAVRRLPTPSHSDPQLDGDPSSDSEAEHRRRSSIVSLYARAVPLLENRTRSHSILSSRQSLISLQTNGSEDHLTDTKRRFKDRYRLNGPNVITRRISLKTRFMHLSRGYTEQAGIIGANGPLTTKWNSGHHVAIPAHHSPSPPCLPFETTSVTSSNMQMGGNRSTNAKDAAPLKSCSGEIAKHASQEEISHTNAEAPGRGRTGTLQSSSPIDSALQTATFGANVCLKKKRSQVRDVRFALPKKTDDNGLSRYAPRPQQPTDVPFADGVPETNKDQYSFLDELPTNLALKLDWPLNQTGYNEDKDVASPTGSNSSLRCGASLVYYRRYIEMEIKDDALRTVKLEKLPGAQPGPIYFRASCEAPCWTTASRRYEAPIQIGIGSNGPIIWEAVPSEPKKKQAKSVWTLIHKSSGFRSIVRGEDVNESMYSVESPMKDLFALRSSKEPKIERTSGRERHEVAHLDMQDDFGSLHLDTRPAGTPYRRRDQNPIEVAFVVAMMETLNAICDESAGAGKTRRDRHGRLTPVRQNYILKAIRTLTN